MQLPVLSEVEVCSWVSIESSGSTLQASIFFVQVAYVAKVAYFAYVVDRDYGITGFSEGIPPG